MFIDRRHTPASQAPVLLNPACLLSACRSPDLSGIYRGGATFGVCLNHGLYGLKDYTDKQPLGKGNLACLSLQRSDMSIER